MSASQGRFTSVDLLLASAATGEPQSWNRYTYVLNQPLRLVDPDGMQFGLPPEPQQQQPPPPPPAPRPNPLDRLLQPPNPFSPPKPAPVAQPQIPARPNPFAAPSATTIFSVGRAFSIAGMILAFETPVGGPSPQDVADRNRRRADPSGYAVINFYDVGVWNEAFPHVSVTVVPNNTGNPITSELIQTQ